MVIRQPCLLQPLLIFSAPHRVLKQLPVNQGGEPRLQNRTRNHVNHDRGSVERHRDSTTTQGQRVQHADHVSESTLSTDSAGLEPRLWGQGLKIMPMEQQGVLRTNCIDCLDRTNVGQFSIAVHALAKQLYVMGVSSQTSLDSGSQVMR